MADKETGEHVVGGNGGQAPQFASLCESCAAVPPHLTFAWKLKMSTPKKIGCLAVLAILCIPFIRVQSRIDVEVNWSIQEAAPTDHTVTIQNVSFTVPAGRTVKQALELKGGGTGAVIYAIRGWGFMGQHLTVDGREIPLHQIRRANSRGELRILGMGRSPTIDATIVL